MRCYNKTLFGIILLLLSFLLIWLSYYILLENGFLCSSSHFKNLILPQICKNISPQAIFLPSDKVKVPFDVTSLCKYLCSSSFDITCHTLHLNKLYVFTVKEKNNNFKIVLKSIVKNEDLDPEAYWKQRQDNTSPIPTETELKTMVTSHIQNFLGTSIDETLISINSFLVMPLNHDLSVHEQLWNFMEDHEFLTSYLFHNHRLFPQILGICKNFYAVEYAYTPMKNPLFPFDMPMNESLTKALDLVHLIEKLDSQWKEPIHLCDVKHDHFGWTKNNEVLFLDLDSVLTDSALKNIMANYPQCSSHEDCSYFDCAGKCLSNKHCSQHRVNSNLQILCSKIFLGNSETSLFPLSGLFQDSSSQSLIEAVQLCSTNPGMTTDMMVDVLEKEYKLTSFNTMAFEL